MTSQEPQPEKKPGPYEQIRNLQDKYKVIIIIEGNAPGAPLFNKFVKNLEDALEEARLEIGSDDLRGLKINVGINPEIEYDQIVENSITVRWATDAKKIEQLIMKNYGQQFLETAEFDAVDTDEYQISNEGKNNN